MSTQLESGFINSTIGQHRGYQFLVLCIFIVVGVVYFSHPAQALEPLTKNQMSQVNGKAGVKLQANLRINVSSDFHNAAEINREPNLKTDGLKLQRETPTF